MKIRQKLNQIENPRDLWLLLRIIALASILPLMLRWIRLPTLLELLESRKPAVVLEKEQIDKVVRFTNFIISKNGFGGKGNCLKRSLLLYRFLGEASMRTEINFGIRRGGRLIGHSWLTYQGRPFLDNEESVRDFEPIYSSRDVK